MAGIARRVVQRKGEGGHARIYKVMFFVQSDNLYVISLLSLL
jgi:hypothetical protein